MKKSWPLQMSCLLAACVLALAGCARKELSNEEAYRRFVGTWMNEAYPADLVYPEVRVIRRITRSRISFTPPPLERMRNGRSRS